ncbi:MAG: HupE/UreJ family protein [Chloroflexota bacterium]
MQRYWILFLTLCLGWIGFIQVNTALAHGLEAGQLSVLLDDVKATVTFAPYASTFPFADDNQDGLLTATELDHHRSEIEALIKEQVMLRNELEEPAVVIYTDVIVPDEVDTRDGDQIEADFLQVTMRMVWPEVPEAVDVEYNLFGSADDQVSYLMKDSMTDTVLEGELTASESILRLRAQGSPVKAVSGLWLVGIEHVLTGYDHILFVLALVLVTAQLRSLLFLITTFTVAHTITLAAVAFGFEPPVPSWVIEAIIAASIGILAGMYLFGITADVWWVTGLLGLVHGLGFGQAMTASLGSLQAWGSTLVAITLGVELTHLAIALVGFGALALIKSPNHLNTVRRVATIGVFCVGFYWTVERIIF